MSRKMSSVKMNDKDQLERLAAKILLKTGKKFTQQELLSRCVQFSDNKIDEFLSSVVKENRKWTKEEIHQLHKKYISDFGEGTEKLSTEIDKILYGK
jgi:hypothetical protein